MRYPSRQSMSANSSFGLERDHRQHSVTEVLDQTSKESIIECAHGSGDLIGSCTSSRENCELWIVYHHRETVSREGSYEDISYIIVVREGTSSTSQAHRLSSS